MELPQLHVLRNACPLHTPVPHVPSGVELVSLAQTEISHEAAEAVLKIKAARTDEKFPGIIHVSHQLHGHENVFFCAQWWITEATEVSVRRLWRISPESETPTRAWVDAKRTVADAKRAFWARSVFPLTLLDALTHRALSISQSSKKKQTQCGNLLPARPSPSFRPLVRSTDRPSRSPVRYAFAPYSPLARRTNLLCGRHEPTSDRRNVRPTQRPSTVCPSHQPSARHARPSDRSHAVRPTACCPSVVLPVRTKRHARTHIRPSNRGDGDDDGDMVMTATPKPLHGCLPTVC